MPVITFDGRDAAHNDVAYLAWVASHPEGHILNTGRNITPSYMPRHRPNCSQVTRYKANDSPGAFTEHHYIKVCADTLEELTEWVRLHGNPAGAFTSEGCYCCN